MQAFSPESVLKRNPHGQMLILSLFKSIPWEEERMALAREIVDSMDREQLILYVSELLHGVEAIKNSLLPNPSRNIK